LTAPGAFAFIIVNQPPKERYLLYWRANVS